MPEDWVQEKRDRIERARGPFERLCLGLLGLQRYTSQFAHNELPVYRRLLDAQRALRDWRRESGSRGSDNEEIDLSIRVVADQLAGEIQGAAGVEHDAATIAWIVAGLRCPVRPFCTGCVACFTVACPSRHFDGATVGAKAT